MIDDVVMCSAGDDDMTDNVFIRQQHVLPREGPSVHNQSYFNVPSFPNVSRLTSLICRVFEIVADCGLPHVTLYSSRCRY